MLETINREMLRHHVSTKIFCPKCGHVLDVRTAVSFDLVKDGDLQRTWILCGACYDAVKLAMNDLAMNLGSEIQSLDGRLLFGRKGRANA